MNAFNIHDATSQIPFKFLPRKNLKGGFTLMEILVTVVILALLLTGVYMVLLGTIRTVGRIEYITQRAEIGPGILQIVARDFEHAVIPGGRAASAFKGVSQGYVGFATDRADFVTNVPALGIDDRRAGNPDEPPRPAPMNEVGYRVESASGRGLYKLFRREDYFVDGEPLRGGTLYELYDRVHSFSLEYFDGRRWLRDWDSSGAGALPLAVRIGLEIEVGTPDEAKTGWGAEQSDVSAQAYQIIVTLPR